MVSKRPSFRNIGEIVELAGSDLLTINPDLLEELADSSEPIDLRLTAQKTKASDEEHVTLDEKAFRFELNEDAMATEKTAEGIRKFSADIRKLERLVEAKQ